jgi:hypothetical protein
MTVKSVIKDLGIIKICDFDDFLMDPDSDWKNSYIEKYIK